MKIFRLLAANRRPLEITDPALSPAGASRDRPLRSFTPNHTIRNPATTNSVDDAIVHVSPW